MHRRMQCFTIAVCAILIPSIFLVACGNKGPLYLPEVKAPPVSMSPVTPPDAPTDVEDTMTEE